MAQADETARSHAVVQVVGGGAPRNLVEIDQDVAAEDDVDVPPSGGIALIDQVDPRSSASILYRPFPIGVK